MKIAVPSEGKTLESEVCQSFGRTYYFIVVDVENEGFEVINNQGVASQGGAGIVAAQALVDCGVGVVITFHCGQNAADVLKAADIKICKAVPGTVSEMIQKYKSGELADLTEIHPGHHQHGG